VWGEIFAAARGWRSVRLITYEMRTRKMAIRTEIFMTPVLYGIPNCDTVRKARVWLDGRGVAYAFHDYKKAGIDRAPLERWCDEHGWQVVLNRAGTTFRKLPETERADLDQDRAIGLMLAQPSMIKRPVLDLGDRRMVGFKPEIYEAAFA
jgi:arsenate reductase (glutaredoxin)